MGEQHISSWASYKRLRERKNSMASGVWSRAKQGGSWSRVVGRGRHELASHAGAVGSNIGLLVW